VCPFLVKERESDLWCVKTGSCGGGVGGGRGVVPYKDDRISVKKNNITKALQSVRRSVTCVISNCLK
jgi:hypothetical protein